MKFIIEIVPTSLQQDAIGPDEFMLVSPTGVKRTKAMPLNRWPVPCDGRPGGEVIQPRSEHWKARSSTALPYPSSFRHPDWFTTYCLLVVQSM